MTQKRQAPSPQPNVFASGSVFEFPLGFWFATLVTGVGAGLAGGLLMWLLRFIQHLAWSYSAGDFLSGVSAASFERRIGVVAVAGLLVAVGRLTFLRPTGGHSGELSEAIWFRAGRMPFLSTLANGAFSISIVALGASVGREGAPKQAGAAIASALSSRMGLTSSQTRLLAACGAGAGIAAVYNVPFGGAVFAIEVLLGSISLPLVFPALVSSLLATATSWLLLPNAPTYATPDFAVRPQDILGAALIGPLLGLAASQFVAALAWTDLHKPGKSLLAPAPIVVFLVLGLLAIPLPHLLGNGKDIVQLALLGQLAPWILIGVVFLKPLTTLSCLGSGAPGGLLTPTMSIGAVLGGCFGLLWGVFWPGTEPGLFALLGAGAFLAAVSQGPISAAILVFELTQRIGSTALPLMLAISGASLIGRLIDARSIYSCRIHQGRAAAPESVARIDGLMPADETEHGVISAATPYYALLKRLLATPQGRLYVVDEGGRLLGDVSAERALAADQTDAPLETAAAADLAEPTPFIAWPDRAENIDVWLAKLDLARAPVVDAKTLRLLGFVERHAGFASESSPGLNDQAP